MRQALTAFANAVIPAAMAAHAAASVCGGANAANAARAAVSLAVRVKGVASPAVDVANAVADAVQAADAAAEAADAAANVTEATANVAEATYAATRAARAMVAAARAAAGAAAAMARAVRALYEVVRASCEASHVHRVRLVERLFGARRTVVAALGFCERIFAQMQPAPAAADGVGGRELRRLGRVPRRLVAVAAATLPAGDRVRFGEEWTGMLAELPTRRERARQLCSLLRGAPRQCWVLRRPEPGQRRI
ncbi:hypothetical protein GCM10022254_29640 [Actinomadura meridiana]|uniref:Uncharacterized protein n=1 Tax=Actinomadura meridiana TaxID=559626 RepID=A0ABP8C109_9ACTN